MTGDSQTGLATLEQMRKQVEEIWLKLINEQSERKKESLRAQYRQAFQSYKRQEELIQEIDEQKTTTVADSTAGSSERPNPFDYSEFSAFMRDLFNSLDLKTRLEIVRKSKVPDADFRDMLRGKRTMGAEVFEKIRPLLNLSERETAFLRHLQQISEAETPQERLAALEKLQEFTEFQAQHPEGLESWNYLKHWYYVALRELSLLGGFKADVEWIRKRLCHNVSAGEVTQALDFLRQKGFFDVLETSQVIPRLKSVDCSGGIYRLGLAQFHREMLAMAAHAILNTPSTRRLVLGRTFSLTRKNYNKAIEILNEAMNRVLELEPGEQVTDDVYHIGLFAVPVTQASRVGQKQDNAEPVK